MRTRLRTALAVTAAASVALGGAAAAAPAKPVCNLVADATGDMTVPSANLDIVSADVASDAKKLTAVIRVAKLAASDGTAPTGFAYNFRFMVAGSEVQYYLLASAQPAALGGTTFQFGTIENGTRLIPIGDATGTLDLAKSEVRITAPTSFGATKIKPGTKLVSLQAVTQRRFVALLSTADSTVIDESKSYTAGAASCVRPGA